MHSHHVGTVQIPIVSKAGLLCGEKQFIISLSCKMNMKLNNNHFFAGQNYIEIELRNFTGIGYCIG